MRSESYSVASVAFSKNLEMSFAKASERVSVSQRPEVTIRPITVTTCLVRVNASAAGVGQMKSELH